jgi:hypothetical protein
VSVFTGEDVRRRSIACRRARLQAELRAIGRRRSELRGLGGWEPSTSDPVHGAEVRALNVRSVAVIRDLEALAGELERLDGARS